MTPLNRDIYNCTLHKDIIEFNSKLKIKDLLVGLPRLVNGTLNDDDLCWSFSSWSNSSPKEIRGIWHQNHHWCGNWNNARRDWHYLGKRSLFWAEEHKGEEVGILFVVVLVAIAGHLSELISLIVLDIISRCAGSTNFVAKCCNCL